MSIKFALLISLFINLGCCYIFASDGNVLNPIEEWSLYTDTETNTCFVDFESIAVKLSDVVVKDENGDVVFSEDVSDLPVDAIYEIDLSSFAKGEYTINLQYYTGTLSKLVEIN